jgi:hypothetical protein
MMDKKRKYMISEQFKSDGSPAPVAHDLGELFIQKYVQQLKDLESDLKLKMDSIDSLSAFISLKAASVEAKLEQILACHAQQIYILEKLKRIEYKM